MEKLLRIGWRYLTAAIFGVIIVLFFINNTYAWALVRTLTNGEAFIGFLVKDGIPRILAITIAYLCGTYEIFCWFLLFGWLKKIYPKSIKPVYEIIYRENAVMADPRPPWLLKARRIGEWIYRRVVPQPDHTLSEAEFRMARNDNRYYRPLLVYGFLPGGMWNGVGYALAFDLNQGRAFLFLATANLVKMLLFGLLGIAIHPWMIAIIVTVISFSRRKIEKCLRSMRLLQKPSFIAK